MRAKIERLADGPFKITSKTIGEKTFGQLKFSALRRKVHIRNEDGTVSDEMKECSMTSNACAEFREKIS